MWWLMRTLRQEIQFVLILRSELDRALAIKTTVYSVVENPRREEIMSGLTRADFRIEYSMKIICRCEDITEEEIVQKIKEGYQTMDDLKRILRVTMGLCQGKGCRKHIAKILSRELNIPIKNVVQPTFRPPVKPIPIIATADKE